MASYFFFGTRNKILSLGNIYMYMYWKCIFPLLLILARFDFSFVPQAIIESAAPVFEKGDNLITSLQSTNEDFWGFRCHRVTGVTKTITVHIWRRPRRRYISARSLLVAWNVRKQSKWKCAFRYTFTQHGVEYRLIHRNATKFISHRRRQWWSG